MYRSETKTALHKNILYFIRWTAISIVMGTVCGLIGTAFGYGVIYAQRLFKTHSFMLYLMPVAGVLIVLLHQMFHELGNRGTNLILESISSDERIPMATLPCIFISTILSQAVGASAGKEGAALQIGGCIGNYFGDVFHMDERDKKVMIMSGMSGCFGAIFGTPLAAAMFGIEVISIGVAYYAALVPCVFASFIGAQISGALGLHGESFLILHIPKFSLVPALYTVGLGLTCALLSVCFCILLHETQHLYKNKIGNVYVRILVAAGLSIALALIFGRDYCGAGFNLVEKAVDGESAYLGFLLKMIFTAVALGGGFKGGEIVPTLAVGASFGCTFGLLTGFEPSLCAAAGMLATFVGVTNCPIATMFLGFELFGFEAMPYFAVAVAISFTLSGYYGLYSGQKFTYSKTKAEFINRKAH
ncbi:chloride channel protein [Clostridium sp. AM25-23AC]|uniref:chloride channel protein n=1 Tax=Clostridium sp. AM25-23AC TaxID=2305240 RepID=UPI000E40A018|nr:chloride channel protein [Clostridium sp. AM25-23AC]RGD95434.1 chloride channel protein [Clostridium sp. AM25-23AC]